MLIFPTLMRQNQIKQSYSCSVTFPNPKSFYWLLTPPKLTPTTSLPRTCKFLHSKTVNLHLFQNLYDKSAFPFFPRF